MPYNIKVKENNLKQNWKHENWEKKNEAKRLKKQLLRQEIKIMLIANYVSGCLTQCFPK